MRPVAPQPGKTRTVFRRARATTHRNILMLDIVMLALAFAFFAAGIGYAYACERL
jgi:Kef-type K+ transport system membrane component KefB